MTVYTAYQGVEVVESDPVVKCRHPRFAHDLKKFMLVKDASLLLLKDGTFLVVCDECGYNGLTGRGEYVKPEGDYMSIIDQAQSVLSHKSGTHWLKAGRKPTYTEEQVKAVIKICLKWKSTGIRNWAQAVAEELDQLGFKPAYSKRWTSGAASSLFRNYKDKEPFKNLKAGPMSDDDREALAEMVREAAARESKNGNRVASNARITERKSPHKHTPIDFAEIIANRNAAVQQEEDVVVSTDDGNPTLNFVGSGSEPAPAMIMVIPDAVVPAQRATAATVVAPASGSNFQHLADLPDGSPVFIYKGILMVGKPVKGVEA